MASEEYCHNKAAPEGSSFYYASLFHTEANRRGLIALFALYYEMLDSVLMASDPGVIRIKLHWWREELARLEKGQPRHPVGEELQRLLGGNSFDIAPLTGLPDAVESLFSLAYASEGEDWPDATGIGDFWKCAASMSGALSPQQLLPFAGTGIGAARLEVLQNLRHVISLGFNPLPLSMLKDYEIHDSTLLNKPESEAVQRFSAALIDDIKKSLDEHYRQFAGRSGPDLLFGPIMNRISRATCEEIHHDGDRILSRKVALTPIRKLWIAIKTKYLRPIGVKS